ncbi:hypothetical protein AVEN_19881-1 [Araneus ventricosus]|uniref:Uncharacterized protein n=1 Tax=Araneus ventricosus TaxID=182803 RepID=A0A4Y2TUI3_ARAVE|nr:hypothetical protein AVEN_19881-1 [Araneus ventricosus]
MLAEITTFLAQCLAVYPTRVPRFGRQYCDQEILVAESSQVGDSTSVPMSQGEATSAVEGHLTAVSCDAKLPFQLQPKESQSSLYPVAEKVRKTFFGPRIQDSKACISPIIVDESSHKWATDGCFHIRLDLHWLVSLSQVSSRYRF